MKTRRPHLERYKKQLREGLVNPALPENQKASLRAKLSAVGREKPYEELARLSRLDEPEVD